jgi:hypothetical protein
MANKKTGVGGENIGSRGDEQMVGRESAPDIDRAAEYGSGDIGVRPTTSTGSTTDYTSSTPEPNPDTRTREIRAEIEQTRGEMSDTLNTIQDRLRPSTVAANAVESVREAASERVDQIVRSEPVRYARANAIPTAMVGIGVAGAAWLAFGGRRPDSYRYRRSSSGSRDWRIGARRYERREELYGNTGAYREYDGSNDRSYAGGRSRDEAGSYGYDHAAARLSNRVGETARDLTRSAESNTEYAREGVERAYNQLQRTWDRNPLLVGAAAGILGAIIGSLMPETDRENELLGPARDSMVEGVEQAVQNKVEQVQNVASNALNEVEKAVGIASSEENAPTNRPPSGRTRSGGGGSTS